MRLKLLSAFGVLEHGARRSALLRLAIMSSGLSKVCGLGLQALSIPLLYHSLGPRHYDLFLLLTGALSAISLIQMGAGPGLTQGIAKANALGEHERAASLLRAAFRLAVVTALVGAGIILAAVHVVPTARLFGVPFAADQAEVLRDMNVCVALLGAQVLAGVVDSALAGYQEQVFIHLGTLLANLCCIVALYLVCRGRPTIITVMLVLYGLPVAPRIINLAILSRRRPHLLRGFLRSSPGAYRGLLNVGIAFWAIEAGGLLEQNAGNYVLAHLGSVQTTALFAVVYKSLGLAGAVVSIVTMPLWPAYTDAVAHRDIGWIQRSFRRINQVIMAYSCVVALVTLLAGQWMLRHLLHIDASGSGPLLALFAVYFISNVWTHLHYVTLMGMERIWRAAWVALAENVLMLLFGIVLVPKLGAAGMALAYLAASVLLPAWVLPRMMRGALEQLIHVHGTATARGSSAIAKLSASPSP
jgi:O-antigen/teichoic acid export membrane protein